MLKARDWLPAAVLPVMEHNGNVCLDDHERCEVKAELCADDKQHKELTNKE
jgi:hypothetical protein